jgi:hypothetical protein
VCQDPGFADAGMKHTPRITGGSRPGGDEFKWVNTGVSNVKGAITGPSDHAIAPRYLAAFEWRYNRRFELPKNRASRPRRDHYCTSDAQIHR